MKYIGIVGSRRRDGRHDYKMVERAFLALYEAGDEIVSGGGRRGGDAFAEEIARQYEVPIHIYYAQWYRYGKRAGFLRNTTIADRSHELIACVAADRTGGTEDTIEKFLARLSHEGRKHLHLV